MIAGNFELCPTTEKVFSEVISYMYAVCRIPVILDNFDLKEFVIIKACAVMHSQQTLLLVPLTCS
jgi:hypothetical protein